jgi:hypothetical protein
LRYILPSYSSGSIFRRLSGVNKFDNILNSIYEFSVIDERPSKTGFVFLEVKCLSMSQGGLGHKHAGSSHIEGLRSILDGFKSGGVVAKWS